MNKQNVHRGYKLNYFTKIWEIVNGEISAALNFLTGGDNKFYNLFKSIFNQFMEKNMNPKKLLKSLGLLALMACFFIGSTLAQVYVSSTGGDDGSGAGTDGSPYATIAKALTIATAGQTIYVADGTYANGVVTVDKDVTIVAYSRNGSSDVNHPGFNINTDAVSLGTSGNKFNIGTLTLTKGVTTISTANVVLTDGATVTRKDGSINAAPTFTTNVNVTYTSADNVTAGPELPASLGTGLLTVNPTATKTVTINSAVSVGAVDVKANTILEMGANLTVTGDGAGGQPEVDVEANATVKLNSNKLIVNAGSQAMAFTNAGDIISTTAGTVGTGIVELTGGHATNVNNVTYTGAGEVPNLTITSAFTESFILGSAMDVFGNLVLESSATGALAFGANNINLKGNFTRNEPTPANVTAGTGTLTLNGSVNQTITPNANLTLNNVVVNNPGNTITLVKSVIVAGDLTITNGKFDVGDNNLFLTGLAKTFTNAGEFYSTTGVGHLIVDHGAGNTTLSGLGIFANVIVRGGATVIAAAGQINLAQELKIENGTFTATGNVVLNSTSYATYPKVVIHTANATVNGGGSMDVEATSIYDLEYYETVGAAANYTANHEWIGGKIRNLTVTSATGKNVDVQGPATAEASTISEVVTVTAGNEVSLTGGMTLSGNNKTHTVAGAISGAQTITVSGYGVTINGDAATTSTGASALTALTVTNAGSQTFTINNIRAIGNFSYTGGTGNINFHDTYVGSFTGTFTQVAGTLNISGDKDVVVAGTATFTNGTTNLANSITVTGDVTHSLGNIALTAGESFSFVNNYTHDNVGTFTGGRLISASNDVPGNHSLTLTNALTVPEFEVAGTLAANGVTLVTNNLTVSNKLEFTQGLLALGNLDVVFNGDDVLFESTCPGTPVTAGTGTIQIKASPTVTLEQNITVPRITVNTTGTVTIATDDTTAPITYRTLTVATDLTQTAGDIAIGGNSVALGTAFNRTAGNWTASTTAGAEGWLMWLDGATAADFNQGKGFSIPNLDVAEDLTSDNTATYEWTVSNYLKFGDHANTDGDITVGTADFLQVSDGATIERRTLIANATISHAPKFLGKINLVYSGGVGALYVPGKEWPANATTSILNSVVIASTVPATGVQPTGGQENEIISLLNLGQLFDQTNVTATLADGAWLKIADASYLGAAIAQVTNGTMHVEFTNAGGDLTTTNNFFNSAVHKIGDIKLSGTHATDSDVVLHATAPVAYTGTVTFAAAGNLDVDTKAIDIKGDVIQSGTGFFFENAGAGIAMKFSGTEDQALTLKNDLVFDKDAGNLRFLVEVAVAAGKKLTVTGGDLDFATSSEVITLTSGTLETGATDYVILEQSKTGSVPTQGFTRTSGVIAGNVRKQIVTGNTVENSVVIYPLGTVEGKYKPVTYYFKNNVPHTFNLDIDYSPVAPGGSNGFPIASGDKQITNYPPFFWYAKVSQSVAPSFKYDLELGGEGYTDYVNDQIQNVRIIRRDSGNVDNPWVLQGADVNYDNSTISADFPVVKVIDATGGLTTQGAKFSYSQMNKPPTVAKTATVNSAAGTITAGAITINEKDTIVVAYTVNDPDLGQTATFSVETKPEAATFDAAKKELTWITTQSDSGAHKFIVKADDSKGGVTFDTLTVNVSNVNRAPEFTVEAKDTLLFAGDAYTFTYKATDVDEDAITYALLEAPDSMKIDTATGVVTWNVLAADEGKMFNLVVEATDAFGLKDTSATAKLNVNMNVAPVFTKDVYADSAYVGSEFWADSVEINVAATDANMGIVAGETLTFSFLDPTTAQGSTITKLTDTTAVVKWKAGSITGGMNVFFDVVVSDGELKDTARVQIKVLDYTDIDDTETPEEYSLNQNYPNPFNPTTKVKFGIPFESDVKVVIYNILGQQVKTLVNEVMEAGFHTVTFDASNMPSGVYIYRIKAVATDGSETFVSSKKCVLVK